MLIFVKEINQIKNSIMKNPTLYQLKKLFNNFEDFARNCFMYGTILIDLRTEYTRETYFQLGKFYCVVESDCGKVEKIAYYTTIPTHWTNLHNNPYNQVKTAI